MRCGDPTWMAQNFGFLKMSNFDIYVVHSTFGAILGDPKFGSFHVGSPHLMAVTGHSWLTLVVNCKNELCSPSNNTVSKAFWQKKVLPEQKISYCEGIYLKDLNGLFCSCSDSRLVSLKWIPLILLSNFTLARKWKWKWLYVSQVVARISNHHVMCKNEDQSNSGRAWQVVK